MPDARFIRRPAWPERSWQRLLLAVVTVAMLAAGCGSSSDEETAAPAPATRPDSGPVSAPPTIPHTPDAGDKQKSQPYWVPVTKLSGGGDTTTDVFTIEDDALQWRVLYRCQSAPFVVLPVSESGEPAKRAVADVAACGTEGRGFASSPGRYRLQVTTGGPWEATVEQQIDRPLVEPLTPELASVAPAMTAPVYGVDREGVGTVKLYRLPDGGQVIRLEDFYVTINSDLEIWLSPLEQPRTTDEIATAPHTHVAYLKATVGSMNYTVPPGVDLGTFKSIVIWCEITRNAYAAAAPLQAA